jgi:hypothetical protein
MFVNQYFTLVENIILVYSTKIFRAPIFLLIIFYKFLYLDINLILEPLND